MGEPTADALKIFSLTNKQNTSLSILNYGAAIHSFQMLDKNRNFVNIIVSPKHTEAYFKPEYKKHNKCFGASVGRYAGRISNGGFILGDKTFSLKQKDGVHLHGGENGFQYKFWKLEEEVDGENPSVKLSYLSDDGEEGYPGKLKVEVSYTLTENNELLIEYSATTDKETVINLTNHAYFNLNGGGSIRNHKLQINADKILELDEQLLPSGNFTVLDNHEKSFHKCRKIGNLLLDDVFVFSSEEKHSVELFSEETGIKMQLETNQPGMVVYAPEKLPTDWDYTTAISDKQPAVCLETQNFPDAPSQTNFPSSILKPGEVYINYSVYKLSIH